MCVREREGTERVRDSFLILTRERKENSVCEGGGGGGGELVKIIKQIQCTLSTNVQTL